MTSSIRAIMYDDDNIVNYRHMGIVFQSVKVIMVGIRKGMLFEEFKQLFLKRCDQEQIEKVLQSCIYTPFELLVETPIILQL